MSKIIRTFQLRVLPASTNLALLFLRLGFGGAMLWLHGRGKLAGFSEMAPSFADPWGIGSTTTLALVVFAEVVCAGLLILGLFTRFAALVCVIAMAGAFWSVHGGQLTGEHSGEMAFLYLLGFIAILLGGPGRYAVDSKIGGQAV